MVKIDVAYPYGEKHDQFTKLSESLASNPDILVGAVGVKDYGDKENTDLAERFNVKKEQYPVLLLFKEGNTQPIRYDVSFGYCFKDIEANIYIMFIVINGNRGNSSSTPSSASFVPVLAFGSVCPDVRRNLIPLLHDSPLRRTLPTGKKFYARLRMHWAKFHRTTKGSRQTSTPRSCAKFSRRETHFCNLK